MALPIIGSSKPSTPIGMVEIKTHIETALSFLIVGIGVAYGTGYVVVMSLLNEYGIREAGAEFFKLRYIYVGALCLACPLALLCVQQGLFSRRHTIPSEDAAPTFVSAVARLLTPAETFPLPLVIMVFDLMVVFYCVIAFARPGLFARKQTLFAYLYLPVAVTLCLRLIFGEKRLWSRPLNAFRWLLLAMTLWVSFLILKCIEFGPMFRGGVYNYVILQALFWFFARRFTKWRRLGTSVEARVARMVIRFMILGSLFVLGVFSFAHTVFNYIPAERGGGDFSQVPDCQICFSGSGHSSALNNLLLEGNGRPPCSVPVKIVEETSADIYVAKSADRGGRSPSDVPNASELWRSGEYYPVVFQISRSVVDSVIILNHGTTQLPMPP
jgi:hypothetical protein